MAISEGRRATECAYCHGPLTQNLVGQPKRFCGAPCRRAADRQRRKDGKPTQDRGPATWHENTKNIVTVLPRADAVVLHELAEGAGVSVSEYVRDVLLIHLGDAPRQDPAVAVLQQHRAQLERVLAP